MAIEDFGGSLLSRVNEQKRRQRKKRESYEKKAALASIAVPIGVKAVENVLQTKAANFLASEQMMARKNKVENAIEVGNRYEEQERQIEASNLPGLEYFISNLTPQWEALAGREIPEQLQGKGAYDAIVNEQVLALATREYDKHKQGLALARRMGSVEDYETMSALATKDVRPTNVIDAIGRQISTVFGGKSSAERELAAINSIENSNIFKTADSLNTLKDTYDQTNNLPVAYQYATFIDNIRNVDVTKFAPQPKEELNVVAGVLYISQQEITWNENLEVYEERYKRDNEGKIIYEKVADLTNPNSILAAHKAGFNLATQPRLILNDTGLEAWYAEIRKYNENNKNNPDYIPLNPASFSEGKKGIEEYKELASIFQNITNDPENVKADQSTLLLLGQMFAQLVDDDTVFDLSDAVGQARDYVTGATDPNDTNYGKRIQIPGTSVSMILNEDSLPRFQEALVNAEIAYTNYFEQLAFTAREMSENISGVQQRDPFEDLISVERPDSTDEEERIQQEKEALETTLSRTSAISEQTLSDIQTSQEQARIQREAQTSSQLFIDTAKIEEIRQRRESGEITDEDYQYFLENGELPK